MCRCTISPSVVVGCFALLEKYRREEEKGESLTTPSDSKIRSNGEMLQTCLDSHIRNIEEMLQILEKPAASSLEKVEWSQVINLGEEVCKQATVAGMLWSGENPEVKQLEENMETYFNVLHGFILLCHSSTADAGPTLHASICASTRQVVHSSLALLKEVVSIESQNSSKRVSIPQLSGSVWEACANLKKTPTSNFIAIGRDITHVAVSVKDILREMNELKPAASTASTDLLPSEKEDSEDEEFGENLSPEEMSIAQLATKVVSDILLTLKEVIRSVSNQHKKSTGNPMEHTDALESLLSRCQEIGDQANELGASVYPPQEISVLKSTTKKVCSILDEIEKDVGTIAGSNPNFVACFEGLVSSLKAMESGLSGDVVSELERLAL